MIEAMNECVNGCLMNGKVATDELMIGWMNDSMNSMMKE
jgi:hypothetical protein